MNKTFHSWLKNYQTYVTFSGMIFNFFFITPFSKLPSASSPPGEEDLVLKEVRYLEYLLLDLSFNNPTAIADMSEPLPASTKKL